MSLVLPKTCGMGGSETGLVGTIGVTLLNPDGTVHTARATTGIYEIGGGYYGKEITFDDNWKGSIKWDTGGGSPVYAVKEYYIEGLTVNAIADQVWDEILTGATHNIATSAGRRLREITAYAIHSGIAQTGTAITITLEATLDVGDGIINRNLVVIVGGTGLGQTRTITDYDNTTKVCVVDREWRITPDATSEYQILADDTPLVVDHGVAQAGTATTITLREYASSSDTIYLCNIVAIIGGTGRGQARLVGSYNGTTKVVTICGDDWVITPDTTSVYVMLPYGTTCTSCVGTYALGQLSQKGAGALSCTWTQKDDDENPMDNVNVWVCTDEAGVNVIAGAIITDAQGEVTFMLDAGTYYVWRERAGYNFTNPQTWSVS